MTTAADLTALFDAADRVEAAEAEAQRLRDLLAETYSGIDAAHDDLREIMAALGIPDHARPYSAHEVVQREVLPAIRALGPSPTGEQP